MSKEFEKSHDHVGGLLMKAFFITLCGLLLALIVGASIYRNDRPAVEDVDNIYKSQKCSERDQSSAASPGCESSKGPKRSEIFLRKVSYRARIMYA